MCNCDCKPLLKILDYSIYASLLFLGCYFIIEGDVVEKYQSKRTNFAEYLEPVTELPSITTYIHSYYGDHRSFQYGKDFNISYSTNGEYSISERNIEKENLTFGVNRVRGSSLNVRFERLYDGLYGRYLFRITPLNFKPVHNVDHALQYIFRNSTGLKIGLQLSAENGTSLSIVTVSAENV